MGDIPVVTMQEFVESVGGKILPLLTLRRLALTATTNVSMALDIPHSKKTLRAMSDPLLDTEVAKKTMSKIAKNLPQVMLLA